ncbi:MAG: GAF domain-containing protein [Pseudobdellovibrio sp.]
MSATNILIDYTNKNEFYSELRKELSYNLDQHWITNLSQFSAVVYQHLPDINWAGFYLTHDEELVLGPFQGKPACMRIAFGRGVCGAAAIQKEIIKVDDVEKFPDHIACDSRSRSELVIPLIKNEKVIGVFDIDSPTLARFSQEDVNGMFTLVEDLLAHCQQQALNCGEIKLSQS